MPKQLEAGSTYAALDRDQDGVVSDAELAMVAKPPPVATPSGRVSC